MGSADNPLSVVHTELRVHGTAGASVMPRVVNVNTNATTIMIAERAVDLIKGRRNAAKGRHQRLKHNGAGTTSVPAPLCRLGDGLLLPCLYQTGTASDAD